MNKTRQHLIKTFLYPGLFMIAVLFMGIGYAAINSVTFDINGQVNALVQEDIFITDARYVNNVDADVTNSKIKNIYETTLTSNIILSTINPSSSITYEVSIYNSTNKSYEFVDTTYISGTDTYDNENIVFYLTGLTSGDKIESKETLTFHITFNYKNNTLPANNQLNSILNFKFKEVEEEIVAPAGTLINNGNEDKVFGGPLTKSYIETITMVNHKNIPANYLETWDASLEGNNSIVAWTTDENNDLMRDLYIGTDGGTIALPANSSYMFSSYGNLVSLDFGNVNTSQVTDMSYMFYGLYNLKSIDFSKFDTSNVTNMAGMFYYSTGFETLDLSKFKTSNVTNMSYMFYMMTNLTDIDISSFDTSNVTNMSYLYAYSYRLATIKMNNASFGNITSSTLVFYQVPSTVYIISKDDTARNWIQEKLGSGKGTIVTVAELGS